MEEALEIARQAAEAQMRRTLEPEGRHHKRPRTGGEASTADGQEEKRSIGRYEYGAASRLVTGAAGLLLSCGKQRENSAQKEILPYLQSALKQAAAKGSSVGRLVEGGEPAAEDAESPASASSGAEEEGAFDRLSACKLSAMGLLLLLLPASTALPSPLPVRAVGSILQKLELSGKKLSFCNRVTPLQTTIVLGAEAVIAAVEQIMGTVLGPKEESSAEAAADTPAEPRSPGADPSTSAPVFWRPGFFASSLVGRHAQGVPRLSMAPLEEVSFAISYRPREASGAAKDAAAPSSATPLAARESVIRMGADAMQRALSRRGVGWAVDLQFPQVVLVVEVLPVKAPSAAEAGKTLTGLAVVPGGVCVIKPRLQCRGTGKGG